VRELHQGGKLRLRKIKNHKKIEKTSPKKSYVDVRNMNLEKFLPPWRSTSLGLIFEKITIPTGF
jgi:hypothetical protein